MNFSNTSIPALILIDIQKGFEDIAYWGKERNNLQAEENASLLLNIWRSKNFPIFHIQHCDVDPKSILNEMHCGNDFMDLVKPFEEEVVLKKEVNSAFIGTNLKKLLDEAAVVKVVFVGLTTDHCVSTSARMAGNFGYETYVVSDATFTFSKMGLDGQFFSAQLMHDTTLASLSEEFATVLSTEKVIENLNFSH
jgi:nicotinamidase-related amidase